MNELKIILQELEANKEAFVSSVDKWPEINPNNNYFGLEQTCGADIYVAPMNGMYLPNELNKFMNELVSVNPRTKQQFSLWRCFEGYNNTKYYYSLRLGGMFFMEKIGQKNINGETIKLVLSRNLETEKLKELIRKVIPDEEPGININIYRHIQIKVYPNIEIAKEKFGAEMYNSYLEKFVPKINKLFEEAYENCKGNPMKEEIRNNVGDLCGVRIQ